MSEQQVLEEKIGKMLLSGFSERGNHAFVSESNDKSVLFKKIDESHYFQTAFTAGNYPAFEVSIIESTDEQLSLHIRTALEGWYCNKCQFESVGIASDGTVLGLDDEM
jgi:hypothetical protein